MPITITSTGAIVKPRKATAPKSRKPRVNRSSEKRVYPAYRQGWSTLDYVAAYHADNASVCLTMVEYQCH